MHKCNRFGIGLKGKPLKSPNWKSEIENGGGREEKYSCVWRRGTSETQAASCEGLVASFYVKESLLDSV